MSSLYLKYRPQKLSELDLEKVRETLTKIFDSKTPPHAYLFSGPKGTGKTSAARILAKIVNCESKSANKPCNRCEQCRTITNGSNVDVIELDAASHRGIDDVRALRDAVKLATAKANKKVYIIDEAHMLTTEASNALLKTIEEPPKHVMFILATTNPEKLIDTIVSRTTNINFSKATQKEIIRSIKRVLKGENIKHDTDSLEIIAKKSNGSFRDAVKIIESLITEKVPFKSKKVEEFLQANTYDDVDWFVNSLLNKEKSKCLEYIQKKVEGGFSIVELVEATLEKLREYLLGRQETSVERNNLANLIEAITNSITMMSISPIEQLPLEIEVVRWCEQKTDENDKKLDNKDSKEANLEEEIKTIVAPSKAKVAHTARSKNERKLSKDEWEKILAGIKPINTTIEALLKAAQPVGFDGTTLRLGVYYSFHKERLEATQHRRVLEDICAGVLGNPVRLICTLKQPEQKKVEESSSTLTEAKDKDIIKAAEEIFS